MICTRWPRNLRSHLTRQVGTFVCFVWCTDGQLGGGVRGLQDGQCANYMPLCHSHHAAILVIGHQTDGKSGA